MLQAHLNSKVFVKHCLKFKPIRTHTHSLCLSVSLSVSVSLCVSLPLSPILPISLTLSH